MEADYVIITPMDKKELVLMQLEDLQLYTYAPEDKDDPTKNFTNAFTAEIYENTLKEFAMSKLCCRKRKAQEVCVIAIRVPHDRVAEFAEQEKVEVPLKASNTDMIVYVPYEKSKMRFYTNFLQTEWQETMYNLFQKEIDFEQLMYSGVIQAHFPLHKRQRVDTIVKVYDKKIRKLMISFVVGHFSERGGFRKYMLPLNLIKNYYGEKYAFEFAFLIHYQAWLVIPSFLGVVLICYQLFRWFRSESIAVALDTPWNAIYGIFCVFWATVLVESWKRTEKTIQHLWNCSDTSFSKIDERTEQFSYYMQFNEKIGYLEKEKRQPAAIYKYGYKLGSYLLIIAVITTMIVFG